VLVKWAYGSLFVIRFGEELEQNASLSGTGKAWLEKQGGSVVIYILDHSQKDMAWQILKKTF
jgi:hypothetical protein